MSWSDDGASYAVIDRMQCGRAGTVSVGGRGAGHWEEAAVEADVENQVEEYYYNHLPEELHEAYREIYVHLMKNEDSGSFLSEIDVDNFWKAYYAVLADHPEIFWIGTSAQIEESGIGKTVVSYTCETTVPGGRAQYDESAAGGCGE